MDGSGRHNDGAVLVTQGSKRPPGLENPNATVVFVRWFLHSGEIGISDSVDGGERAIASLREVVPRCIQRLISANFLRRQGLTSATSKQGREKTVGDAKSLDETCLGYAAVSADALKTAVRMRSKLQFDDHLAEE